MKKIKLEGRLSLNKSTVSRLNEKEMENVNGMGTVSIAGCLPRSKDVFCMIESVRNHCITVACDK